MLDWITGPSEEPKDVGDLTNGELVIGFDDAPETPAPLFAVRAFKQALFGTPKPEDVDKLRARDAPRRRQQSTARIYATNTSTAQRRPNRSLPSSPSKRPGILLTPGTERTRRKTVAFGAQVPSESGPNLQWRTTNGTTFAAADAKSTAPSVKPTRPIVEPRLRGLGKDPAGSSHGDHSLEEKPVDMGVPRSTSGSDWKDEFDNFSSKSSLEMRKLVKKEQLARNFAKHKEAEALRLAELLQQEQRKVAQLEEQLAKYMAQLSSTSGSNLARCAKDAPVQTQAKQAGNQAHHVKPDKNAQDVDGQIIEPPHTASNIRRPRNNDIGDSLQQGRLRQEHSVEPVSNGQLVSKVKTAFEDGTADSKNAFRAPRREKAPQGSDIWADEVAPSSLEKGAKALESRASRPALVETTGNMQTVGSSKLHGLKPSSLSDERFEAARKRLAMKREQRRKGNQKLVV